MKYKSTTLLLCALFTTKASAAVTATDLLSEASIINTGGTVVSAVNLGATQGGTPTADATVNGILHRVASASNNGTGADLIPELTINSSFDGQYRNGANPFAGDLRNLIGGIAGRGAPGPLALDVSGLSIGTTYLFQAYWEAGSNNNQTGTVTIEGESLAGINSSSTQLISYTFDATDTELNFELLKTSGNENIWLSGYSLQEVPQAIPEPSTFALLGLGGLALALRRRK